MNEKDSKFFRPLWIRLLVTGIVVVWFVLEAIFSHDAMWMTITGFAILYCIWNFFLRFPKQAATAAEDPASPEPPPKQP
jgi:hypothetical protein